tara:strand:+ start:82 stop:420 length:339 start_codon:yes stop_codon:yes gene_type:complete
MRLILGLLFFLGAHLVTWFQLNGQFIWNWFEKNTFILALFGIPISYLYIYGTKYTVEHFEGIMWPARFIGFGVGILVYALFVGIFFKEGITLKTLTSLLLSLSLIFIQVFWK